VHIGSPRNAALLVESSSSMNQPVCLFGAFARHLQSQPDALLYRYLVDGDPGGKVVEWTYAQAYRRCAAVAGLLSEHGLAGKRVLLLAQPGLDYVATFLGCLMARVVVVPAYPPVGARSDSAIARLAAIATAAQIDAVVTTTPIAALARAIVAGTPLADVPWLPTDAVGDPAPGVDWLALPAPGELAYLQFTSGSTSDPKGVMVTHGNVAHNSDLIRQKFGHSAQARGFSWLPPYHDMGLIGGILQPLYVGFEVTLMSPLDFLKRPIRCDLAVPRDHRRGPGLRLCAVHAAVPSRRDRDRSVVVAGRVQRRRADPARHAGPVLRDLRAPRVRADGVLSVLRPGRGDADRHRRRAR
jgi:acyl-CoA synthetase (AMP-forming)/AMP-acid ligase II